MRARPKNNRKSINNYFLNIVLSVLIILSISFFISMIDNLLFDNGLDSKKPDLSALITKTKYEKKTGHKITIEIHNGCGIPKLANLYTEFLRNEGFDVIDSKNADSFNYLKSQILHHNGDKDRSIALSKVMNINDSLVINFQSDNLVHDLTLILGHDYKELTSYQDAIVYGTPF